MKFNIVTAGLVLAVGLFSSSAWSEIETIDVVVVYPPSLAGSDPIARIANMEQYSNKALQNSKANIRFRVVHIEELDIIDATTDINTLHNLRRSPEAQSLRNKYGADLVTMITPTGSKCGLSYVPSGNNGEIYALYRNYGYSIVGHYCTSSFAHELGHNLTLGHSHKAGSFGGLYPWGRGHGVDNSFVTTMAYNGTYNGPRLQVFSTPNLNICKGLPCGSPESQEDGANAVKALAISGPQIADWYESIVPVSSPNAQPVANGDMDTTAQGEAILIDVLANDTDSDQDILIIEDLGFAEHGSVVVNDNFIRYTPNSNFIGQDDFEYTISDGHNNTATATVIVNVGLGVSYSYFEGSWTELPDFSQLTPKSEGVIHNFAITKRDREFGYAFRFSGQIKILQEGQYHFFVKSNDGSQLSINGQPIVNNSNGLTETSGSVYLAAGLHGIEVLYFQQQGEQSLNIDWQGPNQQRQMLSSNFLRLSAPGNTFPVADPDKAFSPSDTTANIEVLKNDHDPDGDITIIGGIGEAENGTLQIDGATIIYTPDVGFTGMDQFVYTVIDGKGGFDNTTVTIGIGSGLAYEYYEGFWNKLPDFDTLIPVKEGITNSFSLKERNLDNNFSFRYRGQINIPFDGFYSFYTMSDEGSRLLIDGKVIVNNDGLHRFRTRSGGTKLTRGYHDIEVEYFDKYGREQLLVAWSGPGLRFQYLKTKDLILPAN